MPADAQAIAPSSAIDEAVQEEQRAPELLAQALDTIRVQTDRLFAGLLVVEWIGGVILALTVSPTAWEGRSSYVHPHVWAALWLELVIISLPIGLALRRPGWVVTRHVIAVAQMLTGALLIHLTGGRIETHFHVFGSLAFLAFYRDWRVILTGTLVVALDHLLRGTFLPLSVFGVVAASPWRWIEHAAWVVFMDIFLVRACILTMREMTATAHREARLEIAAQTLDRKVQERTADLVTSNARLEENLQKLHEAQSQLVVASRNAGKADVATTVLHNVGNVLNSVNVSAAVIQDRLDKSKIQGLPRVAGLLQDHAADLGAYLSADEKGKQLPAYLIRLTDAAVEEQSLLKRELVSLQKNIDHIKVIVSMQQRHAKSSGGVVEILSLPELLDDAIRLDAQSYEQHGIEVVRRYAPLPEIELDRHKLFQIVTNLLTNARQALKDCPSGQARRLVVSTQRQAERISVTVEDSGSGIALEHQARIFNLGFTTKKEGHGFGLHGAACVAAEMGGTLSSHSDGPGRGATFTLQLPLPALRQAS